MIFAIGEMAGSQFRPSKREAPMSCRLYGTASHWGMCALRLCFSRAEKNWGNFGPRWPVCCAALYCVVYHLEMESLGFRSLCKLQIDVVDHLHILRLAQCAPHGTVLLADSRIPFFQVVAEEREREGGREIACVCHTRGHRT